MLEKHELHNHCYICEKSLIKKYWLSKTQEFKTDKFFCLKHYRQYKRGLIN